MMAASSILLIVADDLPRNMLGSYGAPHGLTPNMDGIGRSGVVFENAFTTSPLCTPSRYSLLTGRYASSAPLVARGQGNGGVRPIKFNVWLDGQANATIAGQLRRRGYRCGFAGKWHVSGSSEGESPGAAELSQREQQETVRRDGGFDHSDDVYLGNEDLDAYAHQV